MEMHERIRELRKKYLKMSQTDFGEKLGVSRSVIKNIELGVLARPDQKLSLIKLMCKEFHVNEDWLLHGTEPMFLESNSFSLDEYAKKRGASELDLAIAKIYFDLPPAVRSEILLKLKSLLADAFIEDTKTNVVALSGNVDHEKIAFMEMASKHYDLEKEQELQALSVPKSETG